MDQFRFFFQFFSKILFAGNRFPLISNPSKTPVSRHGAASIEGTPWALIVPAASHLATHHRIVCSGTAERHAADMPRDRVFRTLIMVEMRPPRPPTPDEAGGSEGELHEDYRDSHRNEKRMQREFLVALPAENLPARSQSSCVLALARGRGALLGDGRLRAGVRLPASCSMWREQTAASQCSTEAPMPRVLSIA